MENDFDPVTRPRHYNSHPSGVEVIEVTEHMDFCLGNAWKYVARCDLKGSPVEDLAKALWYCSRALTARREGRMVHLPRVECGYYPGSHEVARFLEAEPSKFVRTVVGALWSAHKSPSSRRDLETAVDALEREIARRKGNDTR